MVRVLPLQSSAAASCFSCFASQGESLWPGARTGGVPSTLPGHGERTDPDPFLSLEQVLCVMASFSG